ncbi:hypothetical protein [Methylocella tundrae]|uniref:hypothetical protein n=1 Tax=Methylocella tundrae TaxID=227605 RepID=UPI001069A2B3|nr:hypothetical protein [Methylocella tundrae]WPP04733.1 hypothetical protein SIN04_02555 [Methylocella tundrae]
MIRDDSNVHRWTGRPDGARRRSRQSGLKRREEILRTSDLDKRVPASTEHLLEAFSQFINCLPTGLPYEKWTQDPRGARTYSRLDFRKSRLHLGAKPGAFILGPSVAFLDNLLLEGEMLGATHLFLLMAGRRKSFSVAFITSLFTSALLIIARGSGRLLDRLLDIVQFAQLLPR